MSELHSMKTLDAIIDLPEEPGYLPDIEFVGKLSWFSTRSTAVSVSVERAVQHANGREIFIDCSFAFNKLSPLPCRILLRRISSETFVGTIVQTPDIPVRTCTCRIYSQGLHLALVGRWNGVRTGGKWIAELWPS